MSAEIEPGSVFGRLTVESEAPRRQNHRMWNCRCACGVSKEFYANNLKKGNTLGCKECANSDRRGVALTHGMSDTPMYNAYRTMVNRCTDPKHIQYADYGGRGITICERWRESFENFLADMGERPDGMSVERKENDLGYSPSNCVWATKKEQMRNKRTTVFLTVGGVTKPLQTWAEDTGHNPRKLAKRLRMGWEHKRIVEQA